MKRLVFLILTACALFSCCACLKPVSLDAYGYVITIAIDRGREKEYYFTFALQRELGGENTESEGGAIALACEGDTIFEAVSELEGNVPYSLNFSRTHFIVMSAELAREGALRDFVMTSFDSLKIRPSALLVISEKEAGEFVGGLYSNNEANLTKLQTALALDKQKTGMVSVNSVSRLIEAGLTGCGDFCSAYGAYDDSIITDAAQKKTESEGENPLKDVKTGDRVGGLKSQIVGAAVFSGWEMVGELSREETMFLNMALGEFENGTLTLSIDGKRTVTVLVSLVKTNVDIDPFASGAIPAAVEITLSASPHLKDPDVTDAELDAFITERLGGIISERLSAVFEKCCAAGSDAMRFGTHAVKRFSTAREWEGYGWKDRYPLVEPEFKVYVVNTEKFYSEDMQ